MLRQRVVQRINNISIKQVVTSNGMGSVICFLAFTPKGTLIAASENLAFVQSVCQQNTNFVTNRTRRQIRNRIG